MSPAVEYFKRKYAKGNLAIIKLDSYLTEGNITQEEYNYIIGG